jgi:hypothetical protein
MGLEQAAPTGWFANTIIQANGDVYVAVVFVNDDGDEERIDRSEIVPVIAPAWREWLFGKFEQRYPAAVNRAKKLAWQLNQQRKRSQQITYDLVKATQKSNPHDD